MRNHLLFLAVISATLLIALGPVQAMAAPSDAAAPESSWRNIVGGDDLSSLSAEAFEYDPVIGEMCSQISESAIYQTAYDLQSISTRRYPSTGNRQAATYIFDRLSAIPGLEVAYSNDEYRNVIATLPGKGGRTDETIVVGAHYDSTSSDPAHAPGATDNGCGVGVVLELARVMSEYEFDRSIQFAFWNAEENGLLGSTRYVQDAGKRSQTIPLYVNYDSGYYDPENEYVLDIIYDTGSKTVADRLVVFNSLYDIGFTITFNESDWELSESDQWAFLQYGCPVMWTYSQRVPSSYHTKDDTVDLISPSFAKKDAQLGMVLLAETADLSAVVLVPGASGAPRDLNGDGRDEDVNGNGRRDFADVVLYFNQMSWIAANEPLAAFDYNRNGRVDFADAVWLFDNL